MNDSKRRRIEGILGDLDMISFDLSQIKSKIEELITEEYDAKDSAPDSFTNGTNPSKKGAAMHNSIMQLENAVKSIEAFEQDVTQFLKSAK